jgi:hypothetical protein
MSNKQYTSNTIFHHAIDYMYFPPVDNYDKGWKLVKENNKK